MSGRLRIRALLGVLSVALAAVASTARPAHAESLPHLVPRLIEESGWLKRHDPSKPAERMKIRRDTSMPSQWLGNTFHVSLLARDWQEAYSITDGHPLIFDRMRMIRSSRMAVTRFSATGGRLIPFAEIAGGQWRFDPELMPQLPRDTELAAQLTLGFEARIASRCAFAWDVERTSIYRSTRDAQSVPMANVYASFAGLRGEF
jgi:hypothetical protein